MAGFVLELGHRRRIEPGAAARQLDHAAVVGAVDDRLDACPGSIGARIQVRDQPDRKIIPSSVDVAGEGRDHVAVLVQFGIVHTGLVKLVDEQSAELQLPRRARGTPAVTAGLGVDAHVALEASEDVGSEVLGEH